MTASTLVQQVEYSSAWSFGYSPHDHVGFLQMLWVPPTSQKLLENVKKKACIVPLEVYSHTQSSLDRSKTTQDKVLTEDVWANIIMIHEYKAV